MHIVYNVSVTFGRLRAGVARGGRVRGLGAGLLVAEDVDELVDVLLVHVEDVLELDRLEGIEILFRSGLGLVR